MRRSRGTWEHKKGGLGVQALIFIDFWGILGPHVESFSEIFDKLLFFLSMLVSRSLLLTILGSEFGRLGVFPEVWTMMISVSIFCVSSPWDKFSWLLLPGDWLEIWWLFRVTLGPCQIQTTRQVSGNGPFPWRHKKPFIKLYCLNQQGFKQQLSDSMSSRL